MNGKEKSVSEPTDLVDKKIRKIAVVLLLGLVASIISMVLLHQRHQNATIDYRNTIINLQADNLLQEIETEALQNHVQNLTDRITPNSELAVRQQDTIRRFILSYYTFVSGDEVLRVERSAEFVSTEMFELMLAALDENPGGNYHLSLTATNINIFSGMPNEFIATFNALYESDITRSVTQILVVRFLMTDDLIDEFRIISASEVFNFD
jgi:hypothetical protein